MNIQEFKSILRENVKLTPIHFTPEMAQAVFVGSKNQTRRKIEYPDDAQVLENALSWEFGNFTYIRNEELSKPKEEIMATRDINPYGQLGDLLWVRETVSKTPDFGFCYKGRNTPENESVRLDYVRAGHKWAKWTPNIHMPFEACRSILMILSVKLERIQDITEEDAIEEGVYKDKSGKRYIHYCPHLKIEPNAENYFGFGEGYAYTNTARGSFISLWRSINGQDSWEKNKWIRRITFERLPLDAILKFYCNKPLSDELVNSFNPLLK